MSLSQLLLHPRSNLPALSLQSRGLLKVMRNPRQFISEGRLPRRLFPSNAVRTSLAIRLR
jgi:hypothetical protein